MKKILITGSKGQLGQALIKELNNKNHQIILTDLDEWIVEKDNVIYENPNISYYSLDITNEMEVKNLIKEHKPDVIINCAAMTAVDLCETKEELAYNINAYGPKNLSISASIIGATLFHISTDYVFDGNGDKPYIESDITNPLSVYGKSKLKGEEFARTYNDKTYIIRTAWLYGDGKNFLKTMLNLAKEKEEIRVVNDQLGSPTSALELARAIVYIIENQEQHYGVYHGTAESFTSWYDFAKEIFKITNIDINLIPILTKDYVTPAKRPMYSVLENKALKDNYNYIMKDWLEGLYEYFEEIL